VPDTLITCPQTYYKTPTEVRSVKVDMRGVLEATGGGICTGTPTLTATGITTASSVVSTTVQVINGDTVEPGKAITFTVSAGTDGSDYIIIIHCSASTGETIASAVIVKVRVPTVAAP
jgi:hypothetical protein